MSSSEAFSPTPSSDEPAAENTFWSGAPATAGELRHQLELLYRMAPVPLVLSSPEGDLYRVNPGFEDALGYASAEVVGENVKDLGIWGDGRDRAAILERLREID